jgi:hypothetical protein
MKLTFSGSSSIFNLKNPNTYFAGNFTKSPNVWRDIGMCLKALRDHMSSTLKVLATLRKTPDNFVGEIGKWPTEIGYGTVSVGHSSNPVSLTVDLVA